MEEGGREGQRRREKEGGGMACMQLCPCIWAYGLGVPLLFHYKVRGGEEGGRKGEGKGGKGGGGGEGEGGRRALRAGKGRGLTKYLFIWVYGLGVPLLFH